jgi:hypothetical protein
VPAIAYGGGDPDAGEVAVQHAGRLRGAFPRDPGYHRDDGGGAGIARAPPP